MTHPRISIVIPVYNDGDLILDTLRSLAEQTIIPYEIVVVDDGSTRVPLPDQAAINTAAGQEVTVITQANAGAPAARNRGYEATTGEFILFCDADLTFVPTALEQYHKALVANPAATFSYCQYQFGKKLMKAHPFDPEFLKQQNYINTMSLVRRNDDIVWDESLKRLQDWDFFLHLVRRGHTGVFIPKPLFFVQKTNGMSTWLPSFAYKLPWKYLPYIRPRVEKYEAAREIVQKKYQ